MSEDVRAGMSSQPLPKPKNQFSAHPRLPRRHYHRTFFRNMASDFMFCDLCGTLLSMNSIHYAECSLCRFEKDAKELIGRGISYKVSAEDLRKDLGISQFGKLEVQDMEINKKCEKCSNTKLRFSTRQMRSADEGQTTFFHCPVCSHTFTEN